MDNGFTVDNFLTNKLVAQRKLPYTRLEYLPNPDPYGDTYNPETGEVYKVPQSTLDELRRQGKIKTSPPVSPLIGAGASAIQQSKPTPEFLEAVRQQSMKNKQMMVPAPAPLFPKRKAGVLPNVPIPRRPVRPINMERVSQRKDFYNKQREAIMRAILANMGIE